MAVSSVTADSDAQEGVGKGGKCGRKARLALSDPENGQWEADGWLGLAEEQLAQAAQIVGADSLWCRASAAQAKERALNALARSWCVADQCRAGYRIPAGASAKRWGLVLISHPSKYTGCTSFGKTAVLRAAIPQPQALAATAGRPSTLRGPWASS